MANVETAQLHDFVNGETVDEAKLDQNFEVLRVAGNDTNTKVNTITSTAALKGANSDITSMTGVTGGISSPDFVQFDTAAGASSGVGKLKWNATDGTLDFGLVGGNVNLQIGQEQVLRVYNNTGSNMTKGQVVYITGSSGQRPTIAPALGTGDPTSARTIGILTENINNGQEGFVCMSGIIHDINTQGLIEGQAIWLSPTVAGQYTQTRPTAPNHAVLLGWVVRANINNGQILVHVQNGFELEELHDVLINGAATGQILGYDGGLWKNRTLTQLGIAPTTDPTFTGHVTVPEPTVNTDAASKNYVDAVIALLTNGSPELLNTLDELAAALGDDPNFAATMTAELALKAYIASPTFTGTVGLPNSNITGTTNFNKNQALNLVIEKSATAPASPTEGQLWYDTTENRLKVYRGAVKGWTNISSKGAQIKEKIIVATGGQVSFDISDVGTYEVGTHNIFVFKNKQLLTKGIDYSEASSTQISLLVGATVGDIVDLIWFENDPEVLTINVQSTVNRTFATSTAGQTVFNVAGGYQIGLIDVYMNGVRLELTTDYIATDGATVVLTSPVTEGQRLEFFVYDYAGVAPAVTSFNGRGGDITLTTADVAAIVPTPVGAVLYAYKNLGGF